MTTPEAYPPYSPKRLRRAILLLVVLVPWTGLCLLILVPLSVLFAIVTVPLMLLLIGIPGAYSFNAMAEELIRRAHWRSVA